VSFTTTDGHHLSGRLWTKDPLRILIYLHEYREDETRWWPAALEPVGGQPSVLTFDFRGHGMSTGEPNDIAGMTRDVQAAIRFARAQGFESVALVGAGMGAAAGILAVADQPSIGVIGLSTPVEFGGLRPIDVAPAFVDRLVLVAAEDDLSARHSFEQLARAADVPPERRALIGGRAHGVELVQGDQGDSVRRFYEKALPGLFRR
jgi:pimeloyl-ACP methyl ester carboxylesterase